MNSSSQAGCCCANSNITGKKIVKNRKPLNTVSSLLLSIGVAFFPKCPVCWAVYMSMFGSIGISKLAYQPWLLPVFISFLLLHLVMQYRKINSRGYIPLICSTGGVILLLLGRYYFFSDKWMLLTGISLIVLGSLLTSLPLKRLPLTFSDR